MVEETVRTDDSESRALGRLFRGDALIYLVLVLVLMIFLGFGLMEVRRTEGLYSYDPYYHMHISELTEENQGIVTSIQFYGSSSPPQYLTSLHFLTALVHEYSGMSYLTIYRLLGLFCRLLTALALFITAAYLLGEKKYGLLAVILFLSAPYIFYRSIIGYPENLVLPFHILIFNSIVHTLREKKTDYALPVYISAALYIHYRSFIIPAVLLLFFLIFRKSIKYAVVLIVSSAVLAAPVLLSFLRQYQSYYNVNVGEGAVWKPYTVGNPLYNVPTLDYYLGQLGVLLVVLAILGAFLVLRRLNRENFILLLWLGFALFLTRGKQVGLYIPTERMLAYLCIPAALVAALALKEILETELLASKVRLAMLSLICLVLVFTLTVGLPGIHGWVGIKADRLNAARWLNTNVPEDGVIIPYEIDLVTMGVDRLENVATLKSSEWYKAFNDPAGVASALGELFPGRDVYVVSGGLEFSIGEARVVFREGNVAIYAVNADGVAWLTGEITNGLGGSRAALESSKDGLALPGRGEL